MRHLEQVSLQAGNESHHFIILIYKTCPLELKDLKKKEDSWLEFFHFPRYVDELSKLQDAMPADPLEEVEKLLSKESQVPEELRFGMMVNFLLERILNGF